MKSFRWTPEFCRTGITSAKSWVYYFWAKQSETSFWGGGLELERGFVAEEIERILNERRIKG